MYKALGKVGKGEGRVHYEHLDAYERDDLSFVLNINEWSNLLTKHRPLRDIKVKFTRLRVPPLRIKAKITTGQRSSLS